MQSPCFHLPQFWGRGETDPCPRPRAPVIDLFSGMRERSQPRHATATGMIKLPVRARANATSLGKRRMRRCGASARCRQAGATQRHRFTLNWRWDGMMLFALLVSRAFCHCSRRWAGGQGRCPGKLAARGAAPGRARRAAARATQEDGPHRPICSRSGTCWRNRAHRPRAPRTGAARFGLPNRTLPSSEADCS